LIAGDIPLIPHFIHLFLDVFDVLVDEMREPALRHQELLDGDAALRGLAAIVRVNDPAFDDLVEWKESGLDAELTDLMRIARMEIPALRAWIISVDERGPTDGERLLYFVHVIHGWERGTRGRNVFAGGMADREHSRNVLLPALLHDAMLAARRSERRLRAVRGEAGRLDIRICGRLVVVHDDEQIVVGLKGA